MGATSTSGYRGLAAQSSSVAARAARRSISTVRYSTALQLVLVLGFVAAVFGATLEVTKTAKQQPMASGQIAAKAAPSTATGVTAGQLRRHPKPTHHSRALSAKPATVRASVAAAPARPSPTVSRPTSRSSSTSAPPASVKQHGSSGAPQTSSPAPQTSSPAPRTSSPAPQTSSPAPQTSTPSAPSTAPSSSTHPAPSTPSAPAASHPSSTAPTGTSSKGTGVISGGG